MIRNYKAGVPKHGTARGVKLPTSLFMIPRNLLPDPFFLRTQRGGLQHFSLIAHGEEFLNEVERGAQVVAEDDVAVGAQQLFLQELPAL